MQSLSRRHVFVGRRNAVVSAVSAMLVVGCRDRAVPPGPVVDMAPSTDARVTSDGLDASVDASIDSGPKERAGPFESFVIPKDVSVGRVIGFSKDDAYLGFGLSRCDPCPQEFDFVSPRKPPLHFGYLWDPASQERPGYEARKKRNDEQVEAKLAELSPDRDEPPYKLRGPFPYPDLSFVYETERDDDKGVVLVRMGMKLRDEAPVYPVRLVLGPHPMWSPSSELERRFAKLPKDERAAAMREYSFGVHEPEALYMNVTHDGSELGFVAVTHGTMWVDVADRARRNTKAIVAEVYNTTGLRHHQAKEFAKASVYFAHAAEVEPTTSLFPYNAACASARLRDTNASATATANADAKAEAALKSAIKLGGAKVRARAARDEDFASVRRLAWFRAL